MLRAYRNIPGDLSKASAYATGLQPSERAANRFLVIALAVFGFFPRWCSSFSPDFLLPNTILV
ncbi:MAG: hypothetical protein ACLSUW_00315 [Akkermansia sp.]